MSTSDSNSNNESNKDNSSHKNDEPQLSTSLNSTLSSDDSLFELKIPQHNWFIITLNLITIIGLLAVLVFNALISTSFYSVDIFDTSNDPLDVSPEGWAFALWPVIYLFQFIWLVYAFICQFRKTTNNEYLYVKLDYVHYSVYILSIIAFSSDILWCFTFSDIRYAIFFGTLMSVSEFGVLGISCVKLAKNEKELRRRNLKRDICYVRTFLLNGSAIFATWISIAVCLNIGTAMNKYLQIDGKEASTSAMLILVLLTIIYLVIDIGAAAQYLKHVYTPYMVLTWALVAILNKNLLDREKLTRNNILSLFFLLVISGLFIIKILIGVSTEDHRIKRRRSLSKLD